MGVVRGLSLVSRTKTASSFAGSVLLALRLIEWIAPGGSDQLSLPKTSIQLRPLDRQSPANQGMIVA